ncbi:dimethylarginine dimethylaminohydrolase family protein [Streptomyces sp. NPDC018057]|uniref:dimethylarginine dimethylaminohydrolase family protein n=1 Tax=unclassified Streptomyces TaxID=2593676 RepID=UPI00379552A2
MCPPVHFAAARAPGAGTDPGDPADPAGAASPADASRALAQWERLREVYRSLGHTVEVLVPEPGPADMVGTADGALVVDGRVLGARSARPRREREEEAQLRWFAGHGFARLRLPEHDNAGEGDFAVTASYLLAGHGFRTGPLAQGEAQEFLGRPVIGLELADPRRPRLDLALAVLDDAADEVAYHPPAFSPGSREVLRRLFPDALLVGEEDPDAFALDAVGDGLHVVLPRTAATGLDTALRQRGFAPVGVEVGELRKAGGGVRRCSLELRG